MRLLASLALLGCGAAPAPLRLRAVSPASIASSDATAFSIAGQGFIPVVSVDLDNRGHSAENTSFAATLYDATDSFALTDVTFASTTRLEARAPAGLVPGTYTLQVTTLADAVRVRP